MAFYADDAVYLAPNGDALKDKKRIREHLARFMSLPRYSLSFVPTEIRVSKARDMAYDISVFRLTVTDDRGGIDEHRSRYADFRRVFGRAHAVGSKRRASG